MMRASILTPLHRDFLRLFFAGSVGQAFFLTGGTALAEFYLHHRYSEDLDLFTLDEAAFILASQSLLSIAVELGGTLEERVATIYLSYSTRRRAPMKALVYHGKHALAVEDKPEPRPRTDEVLVQVSVCGICGSDLHGYLGHSARRDASVPLIMGHEFTGRIVEVGQRVDTGTLAVGDRVVVQPQIYCGRCPACRSGLTNICPHMEILGIEWPGAFAELVAVPTHRIFALPDHVGDLDGSMVETLAVEVHLFRRFAAPLPRTVVVLGAGAQGLLAVQLARLSGAAQIIATDVVPQRLALAERLGASITVQSDQDDVVRTVLDCTNGWGAGLIIDTAGLPVTRQQGVAALAPGGTLALIGLGVGETTVNFLPVVGKELNIQGSYCYSDDDFQRALELIADGQVAVQEMIQVAPLSEGVTCFQRLIDEPGGLTKVLLQPVQVYSEVNLKPNVSP